MEYGCFRTRRNKKWCFESQVPLNRCVFFVSREDHTVVVIQKFFLVVYSRILMFEKDGKHVINAIIVILENASQTGWVQILTMTRKEAPSAYRNFRFFFRHFILIRMAGEKKKHGFSSNSTEEKKAREANRAVVSWHMAHWCLFLGCVALWSKMIWYWQNG